MYLFYNLIIWIGGFVIEIISLFPTKVKFWRKNRINWEESLSKSINNAEKYAWIHCASAGELEQAIPLIQQIKRKDNNIKIAVSFFSSSGFDLYKDSNWADVFFNLPLDTKENAEKLIKILNPKFVLFIRNEIWWNFLNTLQKNKINCYLVNANLQQKKNYFYQKYLDKVYPLFTKIFDTTTYGNTKIERVIFNNQEKFCNEVLEKFCKDSFTIILGSSWQTEENQMAAFYKKYKSKFPTLKIIIAPHEFNETKGVALENLFGEKIITYTKPTSFKSNLSILLLDEKGILKYVYRYANIAIIGGGFEKTVHNINEASVYGIPVIFGPNYEKFEEIQPLVDIGIAFPVGDYNAFEKTLLFFLENNHWQTDIIKKSAHFFSNTQQISERIIDEILYS
jgi:3-deoxy-D-manno-octulosonic-acid transferase